MESKYKLTVGLEIHAELKTLTKMFCRCKNDPDEERPNVNICPVCMAHPGALPVANKKAIEHVIRVGLALGGDIADFSEFDRKNYFYPDIPKGYQISQYKYPIVSGGSLEGFKITRIHLEEDTANNKHDRGDYSLIDFNRAGIPLMELVTDARTFEFEKGVDAVEKIVKFAKEYQLLLQYLEVSDANMEKGEMRIEANISISPNREKLGTKIEIKNLNSLSNLRQAITYELLRMSLILDGKEGEIIQETRGWDEKNRKTFSQRKKEEAQDYRYFPDPDLPKMKLHEAFNLEKLEKELPELPWQRRERIKSFGIKDEDAEMYVGDVELGEFFENVIKDFKEDKKLVVLASNYISSDLAGLLNLEGNPQENTRRFPDHASFAKLIKMISAGELTSRAGKDILAIMVAEGGSPEKIASEKGLLALHDESAIKAIVEKVIAENAAIVEQIKSGKETAIMSLVGKVMKETKGSANPQLVQKILKDMLK